MASYGCFDLSDGHFTSAIAQRKYHSPSRENVKERGSKIRGENGTDVFQYEPKFKVLICRHHGYAVRNLADHLRKCHSGTTKEKAIVAEAFARYELLRPAEVPLPTPLQKPFESLGKPLWAYICDEPECEQISISRDRMRIHCNTKHDWRSTKGDREHWHRVWVQTFFSAAGLQRYFTVDYDGHPSEIDEERTNTETSEIPSILDEWDTAKKKHEGSQDIVAAEVAKTDRTLWFKRTGWNEHLTGSNFRHLSRATRLPGQEERELHRMVRVVDLLIDRCVAGLATLDQETRRWLRSAKQSEPDVRPLSMLQNRDSQAIYSGYMKRFFCYAMRVHRAVHSVDTSSDSGSSSDSGTDYGGSDMESSPELHPEATAIDALRDAKRLFPWRDDQRNLAETLWTLLAGASSEAAQVEALLQLSQSFIFQRVRGDVFSSALLHFLAVLGIDEDSGRLREANDFSYMLAGVVYCVRVLAIEVILPSADRGKQDEKDDRRFLELRAMYLADGSFSPMSKMLSLLAYGKNLALNHGNAGSVLWSRDGKVISHRGRPIALARFRTMVHHVLEAAESLLWRTLMWCSDRQRFELPLERMEDDVTWTKRGISFINNTQNGLQDKRSWMLRQASEHESGRKLRNRGVWQKRQLRRYLRQVDRFRELLLFCVHLTAGQPARGSEITTVRFKNGFLQDRNVFVIHGQVVIVTRYHKSQSQYDKPKVIPRFLSWRVGQLLATYLTYVQPVEEYFSVIVKGTGWSEYVWAGEHGPWETNRLTKVIARETQKGLGVRLTTHDYRHIAISIGRKVVGAEFGHGYQAEIGEVEEPEADNDDALELSAGRGGEVGTNRYGVSLDVIKHLSNRAIDTFRPLSEKWHAFLGLSSHSMRAQKRAREEPKPESTDSTWWFGQSDAQPVTAAGDAGIGGSGSTRTALEPIQIERAMQKALRSSEVTFRSDEQKLALESILDDGQTTPLVVVLPTGGGKSLLFMAPACLDHPGVTIVVVPFRALINNLVETARRAGIDCIEWRPGEQNPAALVFVSADFVWGSGFLSYGELLRCKGLLRRIFVDECHLTFTASDWRAKLAEVRAVRGLQCPVILLTATLPRLLEFELEASMAIQMSRYIRAVTTRVRTRYIVEECRPGSLEDSAVALCTRARKHLGLRKGVVYCRSRQQCERVAGELECAYYHAGAVDNEERLQRWLEQGGLIVATSALGTGVDFPGVALTLHIDTPYGMIDFAQESGRAGRGGEDVDAVIMIERGKVDRAHGKLRGIDDRVMEQFVTAVGCRRAIMSMYLDGQEITCYDGDGSMARCDRCGEGLTAVERELKRAAEERQVLETMLDEAADGCTVCWMVASETCDGQGDDDWGHDLRGCSSRHGVAGMSEKECEEMRGRVRYEVGCHSCHRCGISQKLCMTGQNDMAKCQWSGIMTIVLRGLMVLKDHMAVLQSVGFEGEDGDWRAYEEWLGRRHERRIWGEVVSNAMAALIEYSRWREARKKGSSRTTGSIAKGGSRAEELMGVLEQWERVCLICKARSGVEEYGHEWKECGRDEFASAMMRTGWEHLQEMQTGRGSECDGCWVPKAMCSGRRWGDGGGCRWGRLVGEVAMAMLYVGDGRAREWCEEEMDGSKTMEKEKEEEWNSIERVGAWFRVGVRWSGEESNSMCELVRRWG